MLTNRSGFPPGAGLFKAHARPPLTCPREALIPLRHAGFPALGASG
jgi:hypothetical protein